MSVPASFRNCLGGMDGSVLDTFGGEFEWDRYTVKFHRARGADHNVHIVYGKNLTDFKMEKSIENTITGVHPYWVDNETQAVMELPEKVVMVSRKSVPYQKITVLDCTSAFQEKPSEAALRVRLFHPLPGSPARNQQGRHEAECQWSGYRWKLPA